MPCYSGWDQWDKPGSENFFEAKSKVLPRWERFKHVIDFYYRVEGLEIPGPTGVKRLVKMSSPAWISARDPSTAPRDPAAGESLDPEVFGTDVQTRSKHKKVIHRSALHLACAGATAADAWDIEILLGYELKDKEDPSLIGYRHVVSLIALGLRTGILLGADRPKPWRNPKNVLDAVARSQEWFMTSGAGHWMKE